MKLTLYHLASGGSDRPCSTHIRLQSPSGTTGRSAA